MRLGYVCTNFNGSEFTREAVESLARDSTCEPIIVVVDNNSASESVASLRRLADEFDIVTLILGTDNVGYFRGLNRGLRHIRETHPDIDHIVIGNNDLVFPVEFGASVERKASLFATHPVISPDIVTADGAHQNPHVIESISAPRELVYDIYHANFYIALAISRIARITRSFTDRRDEERWEIGGPIHQGYGACYILGPRFFQHFAELWAPSFLMGEELFLARQLESKGQRVYYEPGIRVLHRSHAATSQIPSRRRWEIEREAHRLCRKHIVYPGESS